MLNSSKTEESILLREQIIIDLILEACQNLIQEEEKGKIKEAS